MSQENNNPLPSSKGNTTTSCYYKEEEEDDDNNNIINSQMVPFVASSSAMSELIESHKAYYNNNNNNNNVKYMECLKNHAAAMGGSTTDGCGEFMAAVEDLKCSACQCHRNFHRKVFVVKEDIGCPWPTCTFIFPSQHKTATPYNNNNNNNNNGSSGVSYSDDKDDRRQHAAATARPASAEGLETTKKRHRTKFSVEQKQKMLGFAERAGWKIQKVDSFVVQQFCQEIGVKRKVLKVWMHNNKHTFAKKILTNPSTTMQLH